MAKIKHFAIYWVPVLIWAGFIFWLSSIPDLRSELPAAWDTILRKIGHVIAFGVLAWLILKALHPLNRQKILAAGLSSLLYAISDEIHQQFVPGRTGTASDIIIDAIGIALVCLHTAAKIKQKPQ